MNALLAVPGNHTCADCAPGEMAFSASGKVQRPLWASVNLGVVLSVQAAGVHRKLGVQTSKVLSLTMDEWKSSDYEGMLTRGNDVVNAELEASLKKFPSVHKPSMIVRQADDKDNNNSNNTAASAAAGDMRVLEAYIKAKYVSKSFVIGGDGAVDQALDSGGGGGGAAGSARKTKSSSSSSTTSSSTPGSGAYLGATIEYTGMLCVKVVNAEGLPSMDIGSPSDPYAVVRLPPGQERRTKTVWDCNYPTWNESLMFNTGNLSKQTLEVWVWDEDVVKADDVIGVAKFQLSELVDGDHGDGETGTGTGNVTRRVTLPLAKPEGKSSFFSKLFGCCAAQGEGGNLGTVTLELEFMPLNNE